MRLNPALAAGALCLGAGLVLPACDRDKPVATKADDELTIVVQADKTRIAAEEATLQEQRKVLETERERLRKEIERLGDVQNAPDEKKAANDAQTQDLLKRAIKLFKEQEEIAVKRDALTQERDTLLSKVIEPGGRPIPVAQPAPGQPAGAAVGAQAEVARLTGQVAAREKEIGGREKVLAERERTVADRERELAEREKGLAGREAAFAQRDSACVANAPKPRPVDRSSDLTRTAVEKAYKAMLAGMDGKGVLVADLAPGKQKSLAEAGAFRAGGDLAKAMDAIEAVEAAVNAVAIDGDFVSAKVKRVNAMQQKRAPDAKTKEEIGKALQEVTRAFSDGRYVEANRALNGIVTLFEKK